MWYVFGDEEVQKNLPNKSEADEVAGVIREAKEKLAEFTERQAVLGAEEQEILQQNNSADESLVWVTVVECLGIVALAVAEMLVLSRFISKKELI